MNVVGSPPEMRCLCCNEPCGAPYPGSPQKAVIFTSHGNWGSTVLDGSRVALMAFVCDACVTERSERMVGFHDKKPPATRTYVPAKQVLDDDEISLLEEKQ